MTGSPSSRFFAVVRTRGRHAVPRRLGAIGLLVALVAPGALTTDLLTSAARAATLDVCASTCTYSSIQDAIDAATAGDIITVGAGTYAESLTIGTSLTIEGPNAGVNANDLSSAPDENSSRVAEAILRPADADGDAITLQPNAANLVVTLDGLTVDMQDSSSTSNDDPNASRFITGSANTDLALTVENSRFLNGGGAENGAWWLVGDNGDLSLTVIGNRFTGERHATNGIAPWNYATGATTVLDIRDNVWLDNKGYTFNGGAAAGTSGVIANNWVGNVAVAGIGGTDQWQARQSGFILQDLHDGLRISGNTFVDVEYAAVNFYDEFAGTVSITNNLFDGFSNMGYAYDDAYCGTTAGWYEGDLLIGPLPACPGETVPDLSGVTLSGNAFLGGTTDSVAVANRGYAADTELDANGNWWGCSGGNANDVGCPITAGPVLTSPYISAYTADPAHAGDLGFWAFPVTLAVACPAGDPCGTKATIGSAELGSPSIAFDLPGGATATVSADEVAPEVVPSPGAVDFAASVATFVDITVAVTGGTAPDYLTVCVDGSAPTKLWHYESAAWTDITQRQLPSGTLPTVPGKICGQVESLSPFAIAPTSISTTTSISRATGATPSTYGDALSFTATVTPSAGGGTATGTVKFFSGMTELGSCTLSGGACTWDASGLGVAGSPYSIVASYLGDEASGDDLDPSDSPSLAQVIAKDATTTTVTASPASPLLGATLQASATVDLPVATGTVTFTVYDDASCSGTLLATEAVALSSGAAATTTGYVATSAGDFSWKAAYGGDANFDTSDDCDSVTVGAATVTVDVTGSQTYGAGSATFVNAGDDAPGGISVTGTITCTALDDATAIPSATLAAGGSYTIDGDTCSGASLSGTGSEDYTIAYAGSDYTVDPATVTVTVTGSQTFGAGTATFVNAGDDAPGGISVTGTITCTALDDATAIPSATLPVGSSYTIDGDTCSGASLSGTGSTNYTVASTGSTYTVDQATGLSVLYTGDMFLATAGTATLRAQLAGPSACLADQPVTFSWDFDGNGSYETPINGTPVVTDGSGVATYAWGSRSAGVYEIEISVPAGNCNAATNTATLVVAGTGDSSNGGGAYNKTGSGRINFGYAVQVKTTKTATTVTGQISWQVSGKTRFKGTVTAYTRSCPTWVTGTYAGTCGYVTGSGSLYSWNSMTSSWTLVASGVGFRVAVADGGTATVCTKRTCSVTLKPDYFAMDFPSVSVMGEALTWFQLNGGNLTVK